MKELQVRPQSSEEMHTLEETSLGTSYRLEESLGMFLYTPQPCFEWIHLEIRENISCSVSLT